MKGHFFFIEKSWGAHSPSAISSDLSGMTRGAQESMQSIQSGDLDNRQAFHLTWVTTLVHVGTHIQIEVHVHFIAQTKQSFSTVIRQE